MQTRSKEHKNKFAYLTNGQDRIAPQDGPKEPLLCSVCEQKLSTNEKYFKEFYLGKNRKVEIHRIENDLVEIRNYQYKKIKLLVLSILWRLSVTSQDRFTISMDSDEQEILRRMILNENPGLPVEYPFSTTLVHIDGKLDSRIFMTPIETNHPVQNSVLIYFAGILFWVSKTQFNTGFHPNMLISDEKWSGTVKSFRDIPVLYAKFKSMFTDE